MLVPIKWLKEFIPNNKSVKELAELFTRKGIEVKNIFRNGQPLENFIIVQVKAINNNYLTVSDGNKDYAFSTVTYHLKTNDLIGFDPQSKKWLNPSIIGAGEDLLPYVLNSDYEIGRPVLYYLDDEIIELEILPNRSDLMSIMGIARELASYAEINKTLLKQAPQDIFLSDKFNIKDMLRLEILDKYACPDYIARIICDTKIMPSPFWLQWRLLAVGLRPINNVVDATNYIMIKYGTPLHAFDYDKVKDQTIIVRFADKNEKIRTIENNLHTLNEKVLVIADKKFAIALAGIMGGLDTEISFSTKRVLLECACFNTKVIRKSSKSINLSTEASQRFEMGIDTEILETASNEVSHLIAKLSGGNVVNGKLESRTTYNATSINLSYDRVNRLLGLGLEHKEIKNILERLNCKVTDHDAILTVSVPSYRLDLEMDVDLIEEIGRIYGYDRIPSRFSLRGQCIGQTDKLSSTLAKIRSFFIGLGLIDSYSISFCDEFLANEFIDQTLIKLPNPLNERYSTLRPSILATLLDCVRINISRGNKNLRIFEIGKIFNVDQEPHEMINLSVLLVGETQLLFWQNSSTPVYDYFDVKGITETFFDFLKIKDINYQQANLKFLDKTSVVIKYADMTIGFLGHIKKSLLDKFDINVPVIALNLNLEHVLKLSPNYRFYQALPRFPSVVRDFALIIEEQPSVQELKIAIERIAGALLQSIEIFDYFQGKPLPAGKRNLGIRIALQSEERTLNQDEVNKLFNKILEFLKDELHVQIRES